MPAASKWIALLSGSLLLIGALVSASCQWQKETSPLAEERESADSVSGIVVDASGPVSGAQVRLQGTSRLTHSDARGRFRIRANQGERLAASKAGYFIRTEAVGDIANRLSMRLQPLPTTDDEDYHWVDPRPGGDEQHRCSDCHEQVFREWEESGHARAAENPRFLNLYSGQDWHGRDDRGWSLLRDNPDGAGVCTACHAPATPLDDRGWDDVRDVGGVNQLGVHCDYCHKIQDVDSDRFGIAHGRFAVSLLRPAQGQLFFGPLDDANGGDDVFSATYKSSRYCGTCHEGVLFGQHVYSTFSEWLASPARRAGKQCQDCHMKPTGQMRNVAPGEGGIDRDPQSLASHELFPGGQAQMLKRCLDVTTRFEPAPMGAVELAVTIVASDVGHRVPTGYIDRHLLLVVEPMNAADGLLAVQSGPRLSAEIDPEFAGTAGRMFGRWLTDDQGSGPAPFWSATADPVDTRLVPRQPDESRFALSPQTDRVRVRLLYRRFWKRVAETKEWPDETIVVHDEVVSVER